MMDYVLMLVSVFVNVAASSFNNKFAKKQLVGPADNYIFNLVLSISSALVLVPFCIKTLDGVSTYTIILGLIFGVINSATFLVKTTAFQTGPMSFTVLISSCGMLIPTVFSAIMWPEKDHISVIQAIGIVIMIGSIYLVLSKSGSGKITPKWVICCVIIFILAGLIGVAQKIQRNSGYPDEQYAFLCIAFLTSSVLIVAELIIKTHKKHTFKESFSSWGFKKIGLACVTGCFTVTMHIINLNLSGTLPAAIFFPIVNGGAIFLSGLVGWVLFKEKFKISQLIGFGLGLLSIMMVGNVFA